jgi:hypothetical protein
LVMITNELTDFEVPGLSEVRLIYYSGRGKPPIDLESRRTIFAATYSSACHLFLRLSLKVRRSTGSG